MSLFDKEVEEFLDKVYLWLVEEKNRYIEDRLCKLASIYKLDAFREEVSNMLTKRYIKMYNKTPSSKFIKSATNKYIKEM